MRNQSSVTKQKQGIDYIVASRYSINARILGFATLQRIKHQRSRQSFRVERQAVREHNRQLFAVFDTNSILKDSWVPKGLLLKSA
jgi:hypothetical protein